MDTLMQADKIENEMTKSYANQALKTELIGLATGLIMTFFFWDEGNKQQLTIWLMVLMSGPFTHHYFIQKFRNNKMNAKQLQRRLQLFWFSSGCLWGLFILICLDASNTVNIAVLIGLTAGMLAGAVTGASMIRAIYALFSTPFCLLYSFAMFSVTEVDLSIMGLLGFIMLGIMLMLSHQLHKDFKHSITLRFENLELLAKLKKINEDKTQFLAAASHDLRQPHQALGLFLEALDHLESDLKKKAIIYKTKQAFQAMSTLLDQLLDISKLDSGTMRPEMQSIVLQPLLHRIVMGYMEQAERAGLELRLRPTDAIVYADPAMLSRIISNLLSNAIRYTDCGSILIAVRHRDLGWNLTVYDTGCGIPKSKQDSIFQEFTQLKNPERDREKGLGLGLAIVRRLAHIMDTEISVHSVMGRGSCFSVALDAASKSEVSPVEKSVTTEVVNFKDMQIIVVDDDKIARDGLVTLLTVWGIQVQAYASAEECIQSLKKVPPMLPNALIVDYRLRDGQTGVDAIHRIFESCNFKALVLMITGDTAPERIKEAEKGGFPLLHKPVSPEKLQQFLAKAR